MNKILNDKNIVLNVCQYLKYDDVLNLYEYMKLDVPVCVLKKVCIKKLRSFKCCYCSRCAYRHVNFICKFCPLDDNNMCYGCQDRCYYCNDYMCFRHSVNDEMDYRCRCVGCKMKDENK